MNEKIEFLVLRQTPTWIARKKNEKRNRNRTDSFWVKVSDKCQFILWRAANQPHNDIWSFSESSVSSISERGQKTAVEVET